MFKMGGNNKKTKGSRSSAVVHASANTDTATSNGKAGSVSVSRETASGGRVTLEIEYELEDDSPQASSSAQRREQLPTSPPSARVAAPNATPETSPEPQPSAQKSPPRKKNNPGFPDLLPGARNRNVQQQAKESANEQ